MTIDEARRLRALDDYRVMDTAAEESLDGLASLTAKILRAPTALVTFVGKDRQWFKARCGFDRPETPREWSFCEHALRGEATLVVPDATLDPRFADNPLVTGPDHVRFYCGAPLRTPDGQGLGALCILAPEPRTISADEVTMLESLARQVALELEIRRRLLLLEDTLELARDRQRSRELLAAMIVHDMRGPLTAIAMLAMGITVGDEGSKVDLDMLLAEAERLRRMLADILDVCLYEVGGLRPRTTSFFIAPLARGVATRLTRASGALTPRIRVEAPDDLAVCADPELATRILENLLSNGVHHARGGADLLITIGASIPGRVTCEVRDRNAVIPPGDREAIFEAHQREPSPSAHRGHGLGLSFCRMAVDAHGGKLRIHPNDDGIGNCFVFALPAA